MKWEGVLILHQAQCCFSTGTVCEMGRRIDFTPGTSHVPHPTNNVIRPRTHPFVFPGIRNSLSYSGRCDFQAFRQGVLAMRACRRQCQSFFHILGGQGHAWKLGRCSWKVGFTVRASNAARPIRIHATRPPSEHAPRKVQRDTRKLEATIVDVGPDTCDLSGATAACISACFA